MTGPQASLLPDGARLHLNHGPIDLVIDVQGAQRQAAYEKAERRFRTVLSGLAAELPALRSATCQKVDDPIARRMLAVVDRCRNVLHSQEHDLFVTPMASVAGAVADEVLAAMQLTPSTPKAYVNNGGDIAFHLCEDQSITLASPAGQLVINAKDTARGVATSGWGGRSHSLGIADAVTVAAHTAAEADVAATLIANAVDLPDHPAVSRVPAEDLSPDSDLGARAVTTDVGPLTPKEIHQALAKGFDRARTLQKAGLISQAALCLQNTTLVLDPITKGPLIDA